MNTKSPHTLLRLIVMVLIAALLLAACGSKPNGNGQPPATEEPSQGGGTWNGTTPPDSPSSGVDVSANILLDPATATDADSMLVNGYIFQTLIALQNNEIVGQLASGWSASDDGLDYIFDLRPGIIFHDGTAFNADAVIANFNRWFTGGSAFAGWENAFGGFQGEVDEAGKPKSSYDGIEKVNDFQVLVHLNRPDQNFLAKLTDPAFSIASPNSLDAHMGMAATGAVGTGPYTIGDWTTDTLTLVAFPDYWGETATGTAVFNLK